MRLTFHGGADSVTGANYLLESGGTSILIDCGLQQGSKYAERKNFEAFPYDPAGIAGVVITHAHIDHTGRIPKLYHHGFRGEIHSTPPTRNFAEYLLLDSEHILKREAEREKKDPIYTIEDVKASIESWRGHHYHKPFSIGPFKIELYDAGHILGSSVVVIEAEGKRVVFSGDLGNFPAPIIRATEMIEHADYCLVESTYGDRVHENVDERKEELEDAIEDTVKKGGVLMVPAFAMERTQELLFHLNDLVEKGRIPRVPVFIDSPLAIRLTQVYKKYRDYYNKEAEKLIAAGDDILNFPGLHFTLTRSQSMEIANVKPPKVILAGSGMSQGGRIIHHEKRYLPDPKSTILFIGYQAKGSLGRRILEGAKVVKMFGKTVEVKCERRAIGGYSAHADQPRLLEWLTPMRTSLKKLFVIQGEDGPRAALAQRARDELAIDTEIPHDGDVVVL